MRSAGDPSVKSDATTAMRDRLVAEPVRVAADAARRPEPTGNAATPANAESPMPRSVEQLGPLIESHLAAFVRGAPLPENLREAVSYSALSGGKRLRPLLALLSAQAVGGDERLALPSATALELVHAFSLVHDDLPAMDDDDLRRGLPTCHVKYGEAMAILAGDAMLSLAFQALASQSPDPALAGALAFELAQGTTAMIAGQVYDTLGGLPQLSTEAERVALIHMNKTGALLCASCRMGATAALWPDVRPEAMDAITRYGWAVGLMFQIVDDILDVEQTTEALGKRAGKDRDAGKRTYPGAIGVEESRREVERLRQAALDALAPLGDRAQPLADVCEFLAVRTR